MSDQKRFVGRIGLVGIANIIGRFTMLLLVPVLTKNLSVEDYGLWVIVAATVGLVPALLNLGLPNALMRFLPSMKDRESRKDIFYSVALIILLTSGVATILLFALAGPISTSLLRNQVVIAQILAIIIFINCLLSPPLAFFNGIVRFRYYAFLTIAKNVFGLIIITIMISGGEGIAGAVLGLAISDGIVTVIGYSLVVREIGLKFPSFGKIREQLGYGLPLVPSSLSSWVVRSSDRYVIGLLLGAAFVGYYSPAYTLGDVIIMYAAPISMVLFPTLSRLYDEGRMDSLESTLAYSIKYYLALGIPTLFGLSLLSFPLLNILTTHEIAINGYQITPVVCFGCLFFGLFTLISGVLMVTKKTKAIGSIWMISAIVNLSLNIILIPIIGIMGAAITTLIAFAFSSITVFILSRKEITIRVDVTFIAKSILASVIMSIVLIMWYTTDLLMVIIQIALCSGIYFSVLLALKGFSSQEIKFFLGFLPWTKS